MASDALVPATVQVSVPSIKPVLPCSSYSVRQQQQPHHHQQQFQSAVPTWHTASAENIRSLFAVFYLSVRLLLIMTLRFVQRMHAARHGQSVRRSTTHTLTHTDTHMQTKLPGFICLSVYVLCSTSSTHYPILYRRLQRHILLAYPRMCAHIWMAALYFGLIAMLLLMACAERIGFGVFNVFSFNCFRYKNLRENRTTE